MYLLRLSIKSIARNMTLYVIFGVLLVILLVTVFVLLAVNSDARGKIDTVLREYGSAYRLQENFGELPSREAYESLSELSYVSDIEYKKYTHIISGNNLTLKINGETSELGEMLIISGLPDFEGLPKLLAGGYPVSDAQCVVEGEFFGSMALGDVLFIGDGLTGIGKELEIVGLIDTQEAAKLVGSPDFSGPIIITDMDCATGFYSSGLKNNIHIKGIVNGWDAVVYLTDYQYGERLKDYVSAEGFQSGDYSAVYQKEGFENATRNLENLSGLCAVFQRIAVAISFIAVLFFVLLKTNLKIREICILRSMGLSRCNLIIMTVFEYCAFLLITVFAGTLLCVAGMFFFVEQSVAEPLAVCAQSLPLVLVFFLIVLVATPVSVAVVDKFTLMKTIRSTDNI